MSEPLSDSKAEFAIGGLIAGRYQIISELGRGGMSVVYHCVEKMLDRPVAVKVFNLGDGDKNFVDRFQKEARAISLLNHPNIVKVYSSGLDGERPFIVMELLNGRPLEDVLKASPLTPAQFESIFSAVLDAVMFAHEKGIVHRDLKPANIMLPKSGDTIGGVVKILDFSLAKILTDSTEAAKTVGLAGTPYYMSPEQCRGAAADLRSDVYSLGCVMYECITRARPFEGDTSFKIMYGHMNEALPAFSERGNSGLYSKQVKELVKKCLEKEPSDRPQSIGDLRKAMAGLEIASSQPHGAAASQSFLSAKKLVPIAFAIVAILGLLLFKFLEPRSTKVPDEIKAKQPHSLKTTRERLDEASLLLTQKRYLEAEKEYLEIIKRCKATKNLKDLEVAYRDCGTCYIEMKRYEEGFQLFRKRLELTELAPPGSDSEGEFVASLAWAHHNAMDSKTAAKIGIDYINKHEKDVGSQHLVLIMCDHVATFLLNSKRNEEAVPYSKKALAIADSVAGWRLKNEAINSTRLYYMACLGSKSDMADAEKELTKTMNLVTNTKGEHCASRMVLMARSLNLMQHYDDAVKFLQKAKLELKDAPPRKKAAIATDIETLAAEIKASRAADMQKRQRLLRKKRKITSST